MSHDALFYHVTSRGNASLILEEGLLGGWGDAGFGVYTYDSLAAAQDYLAMGGWEGDLRDPVIVQIRTDDRCMSYVEVDPHWPNPEDYDHVRWFEMDADRPNASWRPDRTILPT